MRIKVRFDGEKFTFSPDPATVKRGTLVSWSFQATALSLQKLRWSVYFNHGSPFHGWGPSVIVEFISDTSGEGHKEHIGTSAEISADDPGDYKYGVRVVDRVNQKTLGDDDPRLVVE